MSNAKIAVLWDSEVEWDREKPFDSEGMNMTYRYFSEAAERRGGEAFIAKHSWWEDGLEKAFVFRDGEWKKVESVDPDVVFDKYRFDEETVKLKKQLGSRMPVMNHFELEKICKDKLLTYGKFPEHVAETMEATEATVKDFLQDGKVVLKPRFDFGGRGVKVIDSLEEFEEGENILAQRFVDASEGIEELGIEGVHDLRVIVIDGEPKCSYVRTPDSGLISNVALGGDIRQFDLDKVPEKIFDIVQEVDAELEEFEDRVYSIDFIFDREQKPWILELNSKPGLNFYGDEDIASWKKPLIEDVVEKLVDMKD